MIKQAILVERLRLDNERKELEKSARAIKKQLDAIDLSLEESLRQGEPIQDGALACAIVDGGRYPPWKEICERELGESFTAKMIAETVPSQKIIVAARDDKAFVGKGRAIG